MARVVLPDNWARPSGYAPGMLASGRILAIAGQIGATRTGELAVGFVAQFAQALDNVVAVVRAARGDPGHVIALCVLVTDMEAYRAGRPALRAVWRARFGDHYPAMTVAAVVGLVDAEAQVEVSGLAVLP